MKRAFAAPFVVIACARTPPPREAFERPHRSWTIEQYEGECLAEGGQGCADPEATCNPPPPMQVRCVYGDAEVVDVHEIDGACWDGETRREVACPDDVEIEPPPPAQEPVAHPPWLDDGPI